MILKILLFIKNLFKPTPKDEPQKNPTMGKQTLQLRWGEITLPQTGKWAEESHYITQDEFLVSQNFPKTLQENIKFHLIKTRNHIEEKYPNFPFENLHKTRSSQLWTPAEGGGNIAQAARGMILPTFEEEIWQGNMMFKKLPKIGTKFMLTDGKKKCVIQMGYEIGPSNNYYIGGVTSEVLSYFDAKHGATLTLDYCDQSLPLGPQNSQAFSEPIFQAIDINKPNWVIVAEGELGVKEVAGHLHNDRILEYHAKTKLKATTDEVPWCASFVCWCLEQAGFLSPKSAWSLDFLNYGEPAKPQEPFSIVVLRRGANKGHVGFYVGDDDDSILVLGGNQSNEVNVSKFSKTLVMAYRWPKTILKNITAPQQP